jgi:hypothetical protein
MRRSACDLLAATLSLLVASAGAQAAPIFLVPADDARLAAMLLAAKGARHPVILFDPGDREQVDLYAASWDGPVRCFQQPSTPAPVVELMKATAGGPCTVVSDVIAFAQTLWPEAQTAIATAISDYPGLLVAAAFAGVTDSALLPVDDAPVDPERLNGWAIEKLFLMPAAASWKPAAAMMTPQVVEATAEVLMSELLQRRKESSSVIVVANPNDRSGLFSPAGLSLLAPLLSATHGAPLVLVGSSDPATVEAETYAWIDRHGLAPTHVILAGDELALRSHRIPDPVREAGGPEARGGGIEVRVELFSQIQHDLPQDFAVGRIVAESASQASIGLARQLHGRQKGSPKPVVFLGNADEVFALGETISRTTVSELRNVGLAVDAHFREQITPAVIRRALKQTDLLVWEGHPRDLTLEESGGIAVERAPRLVVLQGCYTFDRSDPLILLEKGTQAVVATSAAIYSASGSAFARAFFDAILYDEADLGTAVRNARNFLLALTHLKRARNHSDWHKTYRAALAFALWGDPTARAPVQPRRPGRTPVQWSQEDDRLTLSIPSARLREASVGTYRAHIAPRVMVGGLLLRTNDTRTLKDLYLSARTVPPELGTVCSPGPGWDVVSLYAPRTQTLTVLARPDWPRLDLPARGRFDFAMTSDQSGCKAPAPSPPAAEGEKEEGVE